MKNVYNEVKESRRGQGSGLHYGWMSLAGFFLGVHDNARGKVMK